MYRKIGISLVMIIAIWAFPALSSAGYTCPGSLIVNGDFEAGNDGSFISDYTFIPYSGSLGEPKTYSVGKNPNTVHPAWEIYGDHTFALHPSDPLAGNMLIVNATGPELDPRPYSDRVWEQVVNVTPDTDHTFSYWIALSHSTYPPLLQVLINDVELGQYDATAIAGTGNWVQASYLWNSGSATTAKITIIDQRPVYSGDDYALDDICFIPDPSDPTGCVATVMPLTAGQLIPVGSVEVSNDQNNIYVTYTLDYAGATFGNLHMWIGNNLVNLPGGGTSRPAPGQLCSALGGACFNAIGLTTYTFIIPFSMVNIVDAYAGCGSSLYVVTHAEVNLDTNGDGAADKTETAFGGSTVGPKANKNAWWFYGDYTICCDFYNPPPPDCKFGTTFAHGTHVWTTQAKSNPEKLPTLGLTQNRWGWAINLVGTPTPEPPITYTSGIWRGAGLNDLSKGEKVGTLTVRWDGSSVTVKYELLQGFLLQEVHLYTGDSAPTKIAPGQFNNPPVSFAPVGASVYEVTVPLTNTSGGSNKTNGVWIVAHAVVSSGQCQSP